MQWTSEKPTKPGWYWFKGKADCATDITMCVRVEDCPHVGIDITCDTCSGYEYDTVQLRYMVGRWYGPIEPPQEEMEK